jgi:hypothetical protein
MGSFAVFVTNPDVSYAYMFLPSYELMELLQLVLRVEVPGSGVDIKWNWHNPTHTIIFSVIQVDFPFVKQLYVPNSVQNPNIQVLLKLRMKDYRFWNNYCKPKPFDEPHDKCWMSNVHSSLELA